MAILHLFHTLNVLIKSFVSLRGYEPNLHDFSLTSDFENIGKCLISQDRRRSSNKENVGSPK